MISKTGEENEEVDREVEDITRERRDYGIQGERNRFL